jgi:hypothetical protein
MNKTISLAAIAMVAVVMGMSAFAPAALAAPNANAQADVQVCHWGTGLDGEKGTEDDAWEAIFVHSMGSLNGHLDRHNDGGDPAVFDRVIDEIFSATDCTDRNIEDPA